MEFFKKLRGNHRDNLIASFSRPNTITDRSARQLSPEREDTCTGGASFLHLPGELRNQIYTYAIYPELDSLTIPFCAAPEHLGANVLSPSLFRVSPQIRSEVFSCLCATRKIKIFDIRTANAFFELIGPAACEIQRLVLVQPASEITLARLDGMKRFFGVLAGSKELKEFRVEGLGKMISLREGGEHREFMNGVEDLRERGVQVQVRWG